MTERRDRGVSRRIEQEIEEILAKAGDLGEEPAPSRSFASSSRASHDTRKWTPGASRATSFWGRLSGTSRLMLLAIIFTIAAYIAYYRAPLLGILCTLVAVGCFISAYLIAFRGPRYLDRERRWRGQPIDYGDPPGGSLFLAVRRWWSRLTRRW